MPQHEHARPACYSGNPDHHHFSFAEDVKVTTTYDLSRSQFSISPAYTLVRDGRCTTLTGAWQQAGNQLAFEAATSLSKAEKIRAM